MPIQSDGYKFCRDEIRLFVMTALLVQIAVVPMTGWPALRATNFFVMTKIRRVVVPMQAWLTIAV